MRAPAARARQRGFFDFSMSELAIIFGVALVVLGPKKLPGLVKQIGRFVGRARHMARQFREQLEAEVNSINEVKPVPRNVQPEVGPAAPPPTPEPMPTPHETAGTEATGVTDMGTPEAYAAASAAPAPEPMPEQMHPEAQIYFALNGTQPEVVAHHPYEPAPAADEPPAANAHAVSDDTGEAPPPVAKPEAPQQTASVEVIFPHDHG